MTTKIDHWDARNGGSWRFVEPPRRRGVRLPRLLPHRRARRGSCRPSPGRACPTTSRWRRCASRTSATAAPAWSPSRSATASRAATRWLASGMEVGVNEGYAKLDRLIADGASVMHARPTATGHRLVAGIFSDRVAATPDWDAPAPVTAGRPATSCDHLVSWFPGFLAMGSDVRLPAGPAGRPTTRSRAWQVHADGVQAVLDDPASAERGSRTSTPAPCPAHGDRPVLHRRRLHAHLGPGPGQRPGRRPSTPTSAPSCSPAWSRSRT